MYEWVSDDLPESCSKTAKYRSRRVLYLAAPVPSAGLTMLADNEQWLVDNHHKLANNLDEMTHGPERSLASEAALAVEEEHVLRCLGAALIMQWNTLQTKLQRELFDNAGSMGELLDTADLRGQIARFLRKRTNGEDETGRSSVQS
jgi:hypothetical protein